MKLLALPSALHGEDGADIPPANSLRLERRFLRSGFESGELQAFGVPGIDIGYASWAGVSYYESLPARSQLAVLIDVELHLQALWWLCSCIQECVLGDRRAPKTLSDYAGSISGQLSRLQKIQPTECTEQRTMIEALLDTSRIRTQTREALALLRR